MIALKLCLEPGSGPAPLDVRVLLAARLSAPIVHWQLVFGDGSDAEGAGPPPATVAHTYELDGTYEATSPVHASPPFTPESASSSLGRGGAGRARRNWSPSPRRGRRPRLARGLLPGPTLASAPEQPAGRSCGRRHRQAGERGPAALPGTYVRERGEIQRAPDRERHGWQAIPGADGHHSGPTRRGERDADGHGAVEREAVRGRAGSIRPAGRCHERHASAHDEYRDACGLRTGHRRDLRARARDRQGQVGGRVAACGRQFQDVRAGAGAGGVLRPEPAAEGRPSSLGEGEGAVPDAWAVCGCDRPWDGMAHRGSLRRNLVQVTEGSLQVTDLPRRRNVLVRAGRSYLARKP